MIKIVAVSLVIVMSAAGTPVPSAQGASSVETLVAPIALYPDQLLAQILLCAQDPASVQKLSAWLKTNAALKGTQLQDAALSAGFEPSFVALALFPTVVNSMAQNIDSTKLLGQVFVADKDVVFAAIQKLRKQAQDVGTLKTTAQQTVETQQTPTGENVIVIEPSNPQIVYVPQYNTQVVYTQAPTTTVIVKEEDNSDEAIAAGLIGFTAGIAIGAAVNNSYYYGPYGWHGGAYMYGGGWDDYYDHREDAREDWMDHREDIVEERGERAGDAREQRTERTESRNENRPESSAQRDQRRSDAKSTASQNRAAGTSSYESRGFGDGQRDGAAAAERSGTKSDAFSNYSSGRSERAASSRGSQSRSSSSRSRSGGGGRRR